MIKIINGYKEEIFFKKDVYHKNLSFNRYHFDYEELTLGYAPKKNKVKTIDLVSNTKKIYTFLHNSIYPFLCNVDAILELFKQKEALDNIELIVDIFSIKNSNYGKWLPEILDKKGIKYKIIDCSSYDYLNINNFYILTPNDYSEDGLFSKFYENTLDFASNDTKIKPFRKVLISRKMQVNTPLDYRCDDHEKLEQIFLKNGFEICYPETQFKTFSEQVTYFNETKILCGLSGGGLINSVFMQSGNKVLELLTSFKFSYITNPNDIIEELHEYYLHIAFLRKHLIFTLSNIDRSVDEIEKQLNKFRILELLGE